MSDTTRGGSGPEVPVDVTMAELNELVQLFNDSPWAGLEVDLRGIHLVLGRHTPPAGDPTPRAAPAVPGTEAAPVAVAPPAVATAPPAVAAVPETTSALSPGPVSEPPPPAPDATGHRVEVTAPVVGTFWVAPSPGEAPFVEVGDSVEAGQQLAIVEVMKLMSDVSAPVRGRVVEVRAQNAQLVEYEQVLFVIAGDDG